MLEVDFKVAGMVKLPDTKGKALDTARFTIVGSVQGEEAFYWTGWRVIKGEIYPPAYVAGRGKMFPIVYGESGFRQYIWRLVKAYDSWPSGLTPLMDDWDKATDLLKLEPMTRRKLLPPSVEEAE